MIPNDGLAMLSVKLKMMMGNEGIIHPTLLWDEQTTILVDAGAGPEQIRQAAAEAGGDFDRLNRVIITHQDMDHIGGLSEIVRTAGRPIEVLAHEGDRPYIEGEKRLIKLTPETLARLDALPEELKKAVKPIFENPPRAKVDRTVVDGEELPYCGGITVIHAPGHTPGHICLYLKRYKTLIAGDVLNVAEGRLAGPVPQYTYDMGAALKSLQKLLQYEIQTVICHHGGLFKGDVRSRIAELAGAPV